MNPVSEDPGTVQFTSDARDFVSDDRILNRSVLHDTRDGWQTLGNSEKKPTPFYRGRL